MQQADFCFAKSRIMDDDGKPVLLDFVAACWEVVILEDALDL